MPATIQNTIDSAVKEWARWGKSTWHVPKNDQKVVRKDDEEDFANYVIHNYNLIGGGSPSTTDIQNDLYAWSAVGMSAIMKEAGFKKAEFPFAQSHSVWIRRFITARQKKNEKEAYWGFRFAETGGEPEVGDLVAYARGRNMTFTKAAKYFDKTDGYESHSDLVVAKRAGEIDVIGANVLDSVTKKTLALNAKGHIEDERHFWFATLKRRFGA